MTQDSHAQLYFTIDSAQGSGTTGVEIKRIRVIDPLIWSILLSKDDPNGASTTALILPTQVAQDVYAANLPNVLFDRLRARNIHPSTYFMGELRTAFTDSSIPSDINPPVGRVPLIGAILDHLSAGSVAVVLTGNTLPRDVDDFASTSWDDRLLLIGTDKAVLNTRIRWKFVAQTPEDLEQIVREFLRQLEALRAR